MFIWAFQVIPGGIAVDKQGLYLTTFQHKLLLKSLETDLRPEYRRRIEIILLADSGQSQTQICEALGCSQETARHWMTIAQTGQAHHWSDRPMGRPKAVNEQYLARLQELASHSPREYGYSFERWTGQWLSKHLTKEMGMKVSACHINRLLKEMGLSTRQTRKTAENETDNTKNSRITIGNLLPNPEPDFRWSLNFAKTSN
ncbi:helix-turn-helix domain-containing protein [Scytonema hofmannii FACHB-248]|uniref:Helix-turn-helix domain-containing protein n=1 Tax=Scytonema hofmannii FACHB-248 TaxID=1842502 RepID=A0ABR8GWK4_9CYAN|nr:MULTISPECIES: helix-turn-helix domain-containing protein [Nostocales]MBD2607479.1 helix-turn-helix domain-containing protein [Scytonema hofmannii FACHB-248]